MDRTAKVSRSGGGNRIDRHLQSSQCGVSDCLIGRNRVVGIGADRNRCSFEADFTQLFAEPGKFRQIEIEDWQFHAVKAPVLQALEDSIMLFGHV